MKNIAALLIAIVFAVWAALALTYAAVPMLYMPDAVTVWGLGALIFLVLTIVVALANHKSRQSNSLESDKGD